MTEPNNGWAGKPGVPLNPEQSGWHCIQEPGEDPEYAFWRIKPFRRDRGCWETKGTENDWEPHEISNWRYLGPCLTPDEATALQAKNARLLDALKFYGDVSKYPAPLTGGGGALWADCGQIARAELGQAIPQAQAAP
jgi:hypothetical protein